MSKNVYKSYQVNMGTPFHVKLPINFQTVQPPEDCEITEEEDLQDVLEENPDDIISKAKEEAEYIIKEAEIEAERLMEQARQEAERVASEVYQDAVKNGYEDGRKEAENQHKDIISEAENTRQQARAEYNEVLAGMEAEAINLILDISRKVIGMEISTNKESLLQLVKAAFDKCSNREKMLLRVSVEDFDNIDQNRQRLLSMIEGLGELEIKADPSIRQGDCIIETAFGTVDAGVDTKLSKIEDEFKMAIRSQQEAEF